MITFQEYIKQADDAELIKFASAVKVSYEMQLRDAIIPVMEKLAEQIVEQVAEAVPVKEPEFAGKTNEEQAPDKAGIDKEQLRGALQEAILTKNINAIAQIIQQVAAVGGEDMAMNAISVARQEMQDALVAGKVQKEEIAALAEAFKAIDGGK